MSQTTATVPAPVKPRRILDRAVVRFAGDSGDGMQLTGEQFTTEAAWAGNDIATLPNFPAEIRAPAGTLFGVSSFQLQFGSRRVYTPGDRLDCLVAMNPAALKVHLADLKEGGLLIVNTSAFEKQNLDKAGYATNPLEDAGAGRALPPAQDRHHAPDDRRPRRPPAQREGEGPLQELLRARAGLVDLHAADRADARLDQEALREERRRGRGEHPRAQGRLSLRRDGRDLRRVLRRRAGRDGARRLPQHDRQPRARVGDPGRGAAHRPAGGLRRLSDHARQRHPARALDAQALPRADVPGRGRDRGRGRRSSAPPSAGASASARPAGPASR